MKQELVKLANHLDNIGHRDLADKLDEVLQKAANTSAYSDPDEKPWCCEPPCDGPFVVNVVADLEKHCRWNELSTGHQDSLKRHFEIPGHEGDNWNVMIHGLADNPGHPGVGGGSSAEVESDAAYDAPYDTASAVEILNAEREDEDGDEDSEEDAGHEEEEPAGDPDVSSDAYDFIHQASDSAQDRIDKMAELMSSEFTNGDLNYFSR